MLTKAKELLILGLIIGLSFSTRLYSQNITKSPYSIIGLGDLVFGGTASNYTLGQTTQGKRNSFSINTLNPASYSNMLFTNIEAGAIYSNGSFQGAVQNSSVTNSWISYLNFALPISIKRGVGVSFGVTPYSAVGYNILSNAFIPSDTGNGTPITIPAVNYFFGRGGLSKFYFGYGMRLHRKVSLGINANYLFGQITNTSQLLIPSQFNMFNLNEDKVSYIRGWSYDIGVQVHDTFTVGIKKPHEYEWVLGGTLTPGSDLRVDQSYILRTLPIGSSSGIKDTVYKNENLRGIANAPLSWKVGFTFGEKEKWMIAADAKGTNWSNFKNFGANDSLRNSWGYGLGASFTPDYRNPKNILARLEYRVGYRYEQSNLMVNGLGIDVNSLTCGVGIPLIKSRSKLNLGFEYITRGSIENGLIKETYYRFIVGISFSDKWFHRYRYD